MASVFTDRRDLTPPCGKCPDKATGCQEWCLRDEYLEWRIAKRRMAEDEASRREIYDYEYRRRARYKKTQ